MPVRLEGRGRLGASMLTRREAALFEDIWSPLAKTRAVSVTLWPAISSAGVKTNFTNLVSPAANGFMTDESMSFSPS